MIAFVKADDFVPGAAYQGSWTRKGGKLLISCPRCGKIGVLPESTVDGRGVVSVKLRCPEDGCGFYDRPKLLGWQPSEGNGGPTEAAQGGRR